MESPPSAFLYQKLYYPKEPVPQKAYPSRSQCQSASHYGKASNLMEEPVRCKRRNDRLGCCFSWHCCLRIIQTKGGPARYACGQGHGDNLLGCGVAQQIARCKYYAALQKFDDRGCKTQRPGASHPPVFTLVARAIYS
jgi:hypothetical protein